MLEYTYTATDANCLSKSITVTINSSDEITFSATLLNPNVLVKRIRSFKYANWGNWKLLINATASTNLDAAYTATDSNGCSKSITATARL
jgi:hypothetical protein